MAFYDSNLSVDINLRQYLFEKLSQTNAAGYNPVLVKIDESGQKHYLYNVNVVWDGSQYVVCSTNTDSADPTGNEEVIISIDNLNTENETWQIEFLQNIPNIEYFADRINYNNTAEDGISWFTTQLSKATINIKDSQNNSITNGLQIVKYKITEQDNENSLLEIQIRKDAQELIDKVYANIEEDPNNEKNKEIIGMIGRLFINFYVKNSEGTYDVAPVLKEDGTELNREILWSLLNMKNNSSSTKGTSPGDIIQTSFSSEDNVITDYQYLPSDLGLVTFLGVYNINKSNIDTDQSVDAATLNITEDEKYKNLIVKIDVVNTISK